LPAIGGAVAAAAAIVLVVVAIAPGHSPRPASSPGASKTPVASKDPPASAPASNDTGPAACVAASQPSGAASSWKLVSPGTLCGLPQNNTPEELSAGQEMVSAVEGDLTNFNGQTFGQETSDVAVGYQIQRNTVDIYRSVSFTGLEGRFRPRAAASAVESSLDFGQHYTFKSVPPGPHGGVMACGGEFPDSEDCVWATPTTLCVIMIIDTTEQLVGSNTAANAVRIRDVLEVPS
jgi:hypothetical protein